MSSEPYAQESDFDVYSPGEAAGAMNHLPEHAQTVVQELWYGDSHQSEYDLEQHTGLEAADITDGIAVLEEYGLVRSRPDMVSDTNRVYWLNIEEDTS